MENQEFKGQLLIVKNGLEKNYLNSTEYYHLRNELDAKVLALKKQLDQKQTEYDRKIAELSPDALKAIGSNETIRKTKFKQEFEALNKELLLDIHESLQALNTMNIEIDDLRRQRNYLLAQKDILICLISN